MSPLFPFADLDKSWVCPKCGYRNYGAGTIIFTIWLGEERLEVPCVGCHHYRAYECADAPKKRRRA